MREVIRFIMRIILIPTLIIVPLVAILIYAIEKEKTYFEIVEEAFKAILILD
jgi:hypothetical protein